jgi:hypothetical protein
MAGATTPEKTAVRKRHMLVDTMRLLLTARVHVDDGRRDHMEGWRLGRRGNFERVPLAGDDRPPTVPGGVEPLK